MFEYAGKEYIVVGIFKELNQDTNEPTGYLTVGLKPIGIPGSAGPTNT
jgi:hypothetical protein